MTQPRLLDLFCCAGGAARGYQQAGFYVVGVDVNDQPRYAGDEFIRSGVGKFLNAGGWRGFDAIHASPPCQGYTIMNNRPAVKRLPKLIGPVRARLEQIGLPWIIENVEGARSAMRGPSSTACAPVTELRNSATPACAVRSHHSPVPDADGRR